MLTFRCFKCGWPINMNRAELEVAVAEAESKSETYAVVTCPQCRRINKVAVKQMRRKLPRDWQPQPAETSTVDESPTSGEEPAD